MKTELNKRQSPEPGEGLTIEEQKKIRHYEINNKLKEIKFREDYQRAGAPVKVEKNFKAPTIIIPTSTLPSKHSDRLKYAIYSKNKLK